MTTCKCSHFPFVLAVNVIITSAVTTLAVPYWNNVAYYYDYYSHNNYLYYTGTLTDILETEVN